jgi:hypothetical protein
VLSQFVTGALNVPKFQEAIPKKIIDNKTIVIMSFLVIFSSMLIGFLPLEICLTWVGLF